MSAKNLVPLIVESYPPEYTGYKFISLIRYNDSDTLNIIDNIKNKSVHAYVLDLCKPENVDEDLIIRISNEWYDNHRNSYPLSVEFSRLGLSDASNKILRIYPIDFVTRIIGHVSEFPMSGSKDIRRKRKTKTKVDK